MKAILALFAFLTLLLVVLKPAFAADILINEFIPNPGTNETEWVEFYNTTSSVVDLSDYFFDDDANFESDSGSSAKIALSGLLSSTQTCFLDLSSYLNNNGDAPSLFKLGNNTAVDTYSYSSSSAGLTYSRIPDGGNWNINQSPSKSSTKCTDLAPTTTLTPIPTAQNTLTPTNTPTPIKTLTPTKTPTPTLKPSPLVSITDIQNETKVLGQNTKDLDKDSQTQETVDNVKVKGFQNKDNLIGKIFILIGIVFLLLCVIVFFYPMLSNYRKEKTDE